MPRNHERKPGARRYMDYTEERLEKCLEKIRNGEISQRLAAKEFNIPRRTIQYKLKGAHTLKPGHPRTFSDDEEKNFVECILAMSDYGFPVDKVELRFIIKSYLNRCGRIVKEFKDNLPSSEWALGFLKRHPELTVRFASNIKRSRAGIDDKTLKDYHSNLAEVLHGVPPHNIWNYDETNLTDDPGQKKVLTKRGAKYPERICNTSKSTISVMFAGNAEGDILPPYVVYKSSHLWSTWTEGGPTGCRFSNTKSVWFDTNTFTDWFDSLMLPRLKKQEGRKVLIGDNLSSHLSRHVIDKCKQFNIDFVCLPPNSTHITQPLDVAFFHPMKVAWRKILASYKMSSSGQKQAILQKQDFPKLLNELINSLTNAKQSLQSGFKKCGIYPCNEEELLRKLPGRSINLSSIHSSFLETLEQRRLDSCGGQKRRRRKVELAPGKSLSVGAEDEEINPEEQSEVVQINQGNAVPSTSAFHASCSQPQEENSKEKHEHVQRSRKIRKLNQSAIEQCLSTDQEDEESCDWNLSNELKEYEDQVEFENFVSTGEQKTPSFQPLKKKAGQYVVFLNEGEYFPGKIESLQEDGAVISAMVKSRNNWKWPAKADKILYKWAHIIGSIEEPKLVSKRGIFRIAQLESRWGI